MIGRVASIKTDPDLSVRVVLTSGEELVLGREDDALQNGPSDGALLLFGTQPERWYLSPTFNEDLGCFPVSASKAYSEPNAVVLAFSRWPRGGVRLPKAPGFDDSRLVTKNSDRRAWNTRG